MAQKQQYEKPELNEVGSVLDHTLQQDYSGIADGSFVIQPGGPIPPGIAS